MKKIVIYYSLTGNIKNAAAIIASQIGADLLELKIKNAPTSKFKMFYTAGKSATLNELLELDSYQFESNKYDVIIFGTPIWAGKSATAIRTFLSENDLSGKNIAVFTCSGNGKNEKCIDYFINQFAGLISKCSLLDSKHPKSKNNIEKINNFISQINEFEYKDKYTTG